MGTKLKPGKFDCYENAAPDEPMFVLLARDPMAPLLVRLWADLREHAAGNPSKVFEARTCAIDMEKWRLRKQEAKLPARVSPPGAEAPPPEEL
jgi:hypothetical protein